MQIRKATLEDIDLLINVRIDCLLNANKEQGLNDIESLKVKVREYFEKWMPIGGFAAFIAEDEGRVCSAAFLSIVERPPRSATSSCLVGTIYNVFTYPQFRRNGLATMVMSALLEEAKKMDVSSLDLLATESGKPLYDKLGFQIPSKTYMQMQLY